MSKPFLVTDASPLIILLKSGLSFILPALYESIFVTDAVWDEVMAGDEGDIARQMLPDVLWVTRCSVSKANDAVKAYDLGHGETETISFALELRNVEVLLDDAAGRNCAKALGLAVVGTGGLLVAAERERLIGSLPDALRRVKQAGLWIGPNVESLLLRKVKESSP